MEGGEGEEGGIGGGEGERKGERKGERERVTEGWRGDEKENFFSAYPLMSSYWVSIQKSHLTVSRGYDSEA